MAARAADELDPKLARRTRRPDTGQVAAELVYTERRMTVVVIEQLQRLDEPALINS